MKTILQLTLRTGFSFGLAVFAMLNSSNMRAACTPPPAGIVAWWPGQGSAVDVIGTNNGVLDGTIGFATGEVGQAFRFNTTNADVKILASPSLNVGAGNGFTVEAWIYPSNVVNLGPLFEWNNGVGGWGVHFYVGAAGPGSLLANLVDTSGNWHQISSPNGVVSSNAFQHVALTYDKTSGLATIYRNGTIVAQQALGVIQPLTTFDLYLGRRVSGADYYTFSGLIDEPAIYNRALTTNEIAAIYNAASAGKCTTVAVAPTIISQPTNLVVTVGGTAVFAVGANGSNPLYFQWKLNGTNLLNQTNATLVLTNAQLSQAGNYSVLISNVVATLLSSNAVLAVNLPACVPLPSDAISWWKGEGNANDNVGTNNGVLLGVTGYANGLVGTAFNFNSTNAGVRIVAAPRLNVGNSNGFTLESWVKIPNVQVRCPIAEWNDGVGNWGVHFWVSPSSPGELYANIVDAGGMWHPIGTGAGVVASNVFQHVALTYDKPTGMATLYLNGLVVAQQAIGSFTPLTSYDLYLGRRISGAPGDTGTIRGILDETTLYGRALAVSEIAAIYNAGSSGKCDPNHPPVAGGVFTLGVSLGVPTTVKLIGGKHSPTDVDNDPLIISSVSGAANGITSTDGTNVTYTATGGTTDSFVCTISDGRGGTAQQTVNVVITANSGLGYNQLNPQSLGGGTNLLTFLGTPGFNYALERATNLVPPVIWLRLTTNSAATNGWLFFTNVTTASPVFYRTRYVP